MAAYTYVQSWISQQSLSLPPIYEAYHLKTSTVSDQILLTRVNEFRIHFHPIKSYALPWGIQVSRTESRLFLLLKAVLIPITMNAFFLVDSWLVVVGNFPSPIPFSWALRDADNSIWSIEIDLSNPLKQQSSNLKFFQIFIEIWIKLGKRNKD